MNRQVAAALSEMTHTLANAAGADAAFEARLLLAHVLGCEPGGLAALRERELSAEQAEVLLTLAARRCAREPLQYILGEWGFMGLSFAVRQDVLIPRPETEILCGLALDAARQRGFRTALDLCCGTGCVGIALHKLGGLTVTATDVSETCVALTRENAVRCGAQVDVRMGRWFAPVDGVFDMIVCNPPYLTAGDMACLQPELKHEPALALFGGEDGLDAYRAIQSGYRAHLAENGLLLMEVGEGQAESVAAVFGGGRIELDLNGISRVVIIEKRRAGKG